MRKIFCVYLQKECDGLDSPPYPGKIGEKIFNNISKEAWQKWIGQQTILINEHKLSTLDPKSRSFLRDEMEKFLFNNAQKLV